MSGEDRRLGDLLLQLLRMPCVTGEEGPIADWLAARYRAAGESVRHVGRSLVVGEPGSGRDVLLVGHLDVVAPTASDRDPRRDGDRIVGRGASDMKSGLAVAMDAFEDPGLRQGRHNLLLVAYAGEEGPHAGNELGRVLESVPALGRARLAVVLEPTDLTVQLGCLGVLQAHVRFGGRSAHAARPWQGQNALTAAGAFLAELHTSPPEDVTVDGLVYREVISATQAWTGADPTTVTRTGNVVPDRFTVNLSYRFAPDRTPAAAEARLRELVAGRARVEVVDVAPAAPPRRDEPLVAAFVDASRAAVGPKQAWTDVARLSEAGVPALNYGPGLTAQAHQAGEYVPEGNLRAARATLVRFLGWPPTGRRG